MARVFSNTPLPLAGFLALAVAMGIGRFAFTPILPMMQADLGVSLAQGGWLASANYLGYLLGALSVTALSWSAARLLRRGLWLVVLTTAVMGVDDHWLGWLLWRLLAGVASAWVLIGTAALCIARLSAQGRQKQEGIVFAGVGVGVALAGLVCMALVVMGATANQAWLTLAVVAALGLLCARSLWTAPYDATGKPGTGGGQPVSFESRRGVVSVHAPQWSGAPAQDAPTPGKQPLHWHLVLCYGAYGFGYILPATFLPAQARQLVHDPWLFSLAWPVFGLTAAISTLIASRLAKRFSLPRIWAAAQAIMAVGVLLPALWPTLTSILMAACCVGSTFMIITMTGLQQAQAALGAFRAKRQMAAMTASFALGQLVGPVFFSLTHTWFGAPLAFALIAGTV
ncbi:MAG: YbfB/YjiJ family MFS transporter, partial [Candidimonas sp.]